MFTFSTALRITAAILAPATAPTAAQPLVEVLALDCGATYVRVNGTDGDDAISLHSCPSGDLMVVRISQTGLQVGLVPASLAAASVVLVEAGSGDDCVDASGLAATCPCEVYAGEGQDLVVCGPGADLVLAGGGDDTVFGGEGGDTLFGGSGSGDCLFGGGGEDMLWLGRSAVRVISDTAHSPTPPPSPSPPRASSPSGSDG